MNITKSEKITTVLAILFLIGLELFCIFGVENKVQANSDAKTFNTLSDSAWGDVQKNTTLTDLEIEQLKKLSKQTTPWCSTVYR